MRIFGTTRNSRLHGFSLLEIMVVIGLIALMAAIAVPAIIGDRGASDLGKQSERLTGVLEQLNEQSLFLGQMLAARLEPDRVQPLRYAHEETAFVPLEGEGELSALELPDGVRLEWRLEEPDSQRGPDLREAVSSRLDDEQSDGRDPERGSDEGNGKQQDSASAEGSSDDTPPQLFFFPSGEATPITLWLRPVGSEGEGIKLKVNSLGRVKRPSGEEEDDAR